MISVAMPTLISMLLSVNCNELSKKIEATKTNLFEEYLLYISKIWILIDDKQQQEELTRQFGCPWRPSWCNRTFHKLANISWKRLQEGCLRMKKVKCYNWLKYTLCNRSDCTGWRCRNWAEFLRSKCNRRYLSSILIFSRYINVYKDEWRINA